MRIFLDFETYYDSSYSLRRMSPIEYILNPQWETLGCAVAIEHDDPFLLPKDEIKKFLLDIKQPYSVITHNALFDAVVLAFQYNIHPIGLFCTLSMSRALIHHEIKSGRVSLASVLDHLGLSKKGEFVHKMNGKHWKDLEADPGMMMLFTGYAINDVIGCREIFFRLRKDFPAAEARVMDRMIRMATQPKLQMDVVMLDDYRTTIRQRKKELLSRVTNGNVDSLMSNQKFAELLKELGVDPPTKISPATGKTTWAFAKTDHALTDLLEHDDLDVQTLVTARLGIKTTIEETRSSRLISIGACTLTFLGQPLLPMPLKYSGAHTHRYSGDWKLNMQNLSARKSKEIRKAIYAPIGYTIVAVDAAQIEARITAWLARQVDLLEMFARGEDTYAAFAADIFHIPLSGVTKPQRFVGKTCILGLGFGMSSLKLYRTIVTLAREQKIDITITLDDCTEWVHLYRSKFADIRQLWQDIGKLIHAMTIGQADDWSVGPCEVQSTTIILPSGLKLFYDNLRIKDGEYWYDQGQFTKKIYGAKMLENVVQALDRQHVVYAGLRTEDRARRLGIPDPRVLLNIHDENIYCVPDDYAIQLAELALEDMRHNQPWSEGLPLSAEVKMGRNLGEMEEWKP